ncbi:hypothetical protein G6F46_015649 [Rhizopus delemar]|nr:hypothetical protein G6F46_015649 [Rhizopus delemar]
MGPAPGRGAARRTDGATDQRHRLAGGKGRHPGRWLGGPCAGPAGLPAGDAGRPRQRWRLAGRRGGGRQAAR